MISSRVVLSIPAPPPHLPPRLQDWSPSLPSSRFRIPRPQTTREYVSPIIFTNPEAKTKNKKRKENEKKTQKQEKHKKKKKKEKRIKTQSARATEKQIKEGREEKKRPYSQRLG
jgi:hypothetical protein